MIQQQKSFEKIDRGTLYLVPTPIGNLEDMTFRGVSTLKSVDLILAEDTRHTRKLLTHFEITTPCSSFHEHNTQKKLPEIIQKLEQGLTIAQVSDAGTPSISDPGHELVVACIEKNIPVVPLPGANAVVTALIASGIAPQPFYFHGFLPRKKQEQVTVLKRLVTREETLVFYESPFRLEKTLTVLTHVFSKSRQIAVCRELTKRYEEFTRGTLEDVLAFFKTQKEEIKGEICLVVQGVDAQEKKQETQDWQLWTIKEHVDYLVEHERILTKEAIKKVAQKRGESKQVIYKAYHQ